MVYWLILCCLGICIFVTWFLELDQDLLQLFGLGPCHLQCCVFYIQHLWCHFLIIVMLFGFHPQQKRLVWLREFIQNLYVSCHHPTILNFLLHWLSVADLQWFHTAIQIFKSLHRISPPYLHDIIILFQFSKDVTGHLNRNVNHLFVPRVFTNYSKWSFYYPGTVLWNNLKSTVTGVPFCRCFKITTLI